jgi:hypothetical protein
LGGQQISTPSNTIINSICCFLNVSPSPASFLPLCPKSDKPFPRPHAIVRHGRNPRYISTCNEIPRTSGRLEACEKEAAGLRVDLSHIDAAIAVADCGKTQ